MQIDGWELTHLPIDRVFVVEELRISWWWNNKTNPILLKSAVSSQSRYWRITKPTFSQSIGQWVNKARRRRSWPNDSLQICTNLLKIKSRDDCREWVCVAERGALLDGNWQSLQNLLFALVTHIRIMFMFTGDTLFRNYVPNCWLKKSVHCIYPVYFAIQKWVI